ncbi:LytTR family DNA-binding domain-containing protein [Hymenobacter sp. H14-R3]|uniref:LytR/AlgR family response regulator transcription factor n=1 Tax=Hymenobacter sp. H14-R3 TaxID=3046308 RepID=UPI0024BB31FC|nr:LytTR family DNA-binding domain-containing protein [Hymenobacter sp. H14-R3]MDJ0364591.1 LytTR family DNA-binding domain-containing protein [Hymenobacter sp. H14-R3]
MTTTATNRLACIIVDDNEINRLTLEHLVDLTPELELVASLPGGLEALNFFRNGGQCGLVLLDVEMPTITGLELTKLLPKPAPAIVLVTTHRDFAVAAFELQVVDYLVKPVEFVRFSQAIAKVLALRPPAPVTPPPAPKAVEAANDLFVKVGTKTIKVNFAEVLYIEALSTYSVLVTATQKHIVYLTLKALSERLPFAHFVRVHRSYIVNVRRIEAIEDNMIKLGTHEVPVGKSYQEEFIRHLRNL